GQQLVIPVRQEHVVKPGQTGQCIARIYGLDQSTRIPINRIPPPYDVHAGKRLLLPPPADSVQPTAAPAASAPAPAAAPPARIAVEELAPPAAAAPGAVTSDPAAAPPTGSRAVASPLPVPQTGPVPLPLPPALGPGPEAPESATPAERARTEAA